MTGAATTASTQTISYNADNTVALDKVVNGMCHREWEAERNGDSLSAVVELECGVLPDRTMFEPGPPDDLAVAAEPAL